MDHERTPAGSNGAAPGRDPATHRTQLGATVESVRSTVDSGERSASHSFTGEEGDALPPRLGRYEIRRLLGRGGMGMVYAAFDAELEREVALKVLPAGRHSEVARARLRREARTLARLAHPNVVAVHDVGEENGRLYLAMELVRGETLKAWIGGGPRSWPEVLGAFVEAARGLQAAHAAGLVHRDFKPDNVLIDEAGHARVLDFGLARAVVGAGAGEGTDTELGGPGPGSSPLETDDGLSTLTRPGAVMGTPAYMSPEQHLGDATDAATDQFSFCVALWEALYGERPFPGKSHAAIADAALSGRISSPPEGRRIPRRLHAALLRGLESDPRRRWPDMGALIDALEGVPRRRRTLTRASVGALGALTLVLTTFALSRTPAAPEAPVCRDTGARVDAVWTDERRARIEAAFDQIGGPEVGDTRRLVLEGLDAYAAALRGGYAEACLDTEARRLVSPELRDRRVACLGGRVDDLDATASVLETLDRDALRRASGMVSELPAVERCADLDYLETRLPDPEDPAAARAVVEARRELAAANAAIGAVRLPDAERALEAAEEKLAGLEHPPVLVELAYARGRLATRKGDYDAAAAQIEGAYHDAFGMGHDDVAVDAALEMIYAVGYDLRQPEKGLEWSRHAESLIERTGDPRRRADLLHNRAEMHLRLGDAETGRAMLEEAVALKRQLYGERSVSVAKSLNNLSNALSDLERDEEAREVLELSIAIKRERLGDHSPAVAGALSNLGLLEWKAGEFERAIEHHEQSLDISRRAYGEDHRSVVGTTMNLALALKGAGRGAEAIAALERGLETARGWPRPIPPLESELLNTLAGAHQGEGHWAEARRNYAASYALDVELHGPRAPALAKSLLGLAEVANAEGDHEAALGHAREILALDPVDDVFDWQIADAHLSLAEALLALGERKKAREHARLARDGFAVAGGRFEANLEEAEALLGELGGD